MESHTYSIILRDVSWTDIGNAVDAVKQLDSDDSIELLIRHDTSGGTLDDGTTYQTETSFSATYSYALGNGDTALTDFAMKLSQLPPLPDDSATLKTEIKERG
jgi:hypothetical protein